MLNLRNFSLQKLYEYRESIKQTIEKAIDSNQLWNRYVQQELFLANMLYEAKELHKDVLGSFFQAKEKHILSMFIDDLNKSEMYLENAENYFSKKSRQLQKISKKVNKLEKRGKEDLIQEYISKSKAEDELIKQDIAEFYEKKINIKQCKTLVSDIALLNSLQDTNQSDDDLEKRVELCGLLREKSVGLDSSSVKKYVSELSDKVNLMHYSVDSVAHRMGVYIGKGILTSAMAFFPLLFQPQFSESKNLPVPKSIETIASVKESAKSTFDATKYMGKGISGVATYYADFFNGRPTSSGVIFSNDNIMAAVPIGSKYAPNNAPKDKKGYVMLLLVKSNETNKSLIVPAYDVGNFGKNNKYQKLGGKERVIDLSRAALNYLSNAPSIQSKGVTYYELGWYPKNEAEKYRTEIHSDIIN